MAYPSKTDRATILATAMEQLELCGLRDLSLRSIASSLSLTPNAIYRYFPDRSTLEAALAGRVARLLQTSMQRVTRRSDPVESIRGIARAYLHFAQKHPNLYELLLLPCDVDGEGAAAFESLWNFVLENVSALAGEDRATEASVALWAYLHGIAQLKARRMFDPGKPDMTFKFGLNAWIAAACTDTQVDTGGHND